MTGARAVASEPEIARGSILTIDDSAATREILGLLLRSIGYSVLQAVNGADGLLRLRHFVPDLIITDINMPVLNGFQVIERVRREARLARVPILVLSTETSTAKEKTARRLGATGWLGKPIVPAQLLAAIAAVRSAPADLRPARGGPVAQAGGTLKRGRVNL